MLELERAELRERRLQREPVAVAAVPVANQTVCDIERTTLATALDAYVAITGSAPTSEAAICVAAA